MYRHLCGNKYRIFGIRILLKSMRAFSNINKTQGGNNTMRVNYTSLGSAAEEPFWRFIGCCLSSKPEILSSSPDLGDLEIKMTLNGNGVDLLRAWELFTNYQPPSQETVQAQATAERTVQAPLIDADQRSNLRAILEELQVYRDSISSRIADLDNQFDNAVDYAASAAGDIASDYARERVNDEARENGPDFDDVSSNLYGECDGIIDRLEEILDS